VGAAAGNLTPVPGYFKGIRKVCDKYGVLLVLDEIMCGMGRTGKMHAWEWEGEIKSSCTNGFVMLIERVQVLSPIFRQSGKA